MAMNLLKNRLEASGLSESEALSLRDKMLEAPIKLMVEYDLEVALHDEAKNFHNAKTPEDFLVQKGVILGLKKALGILNRPMVRK